MTKFAIFQSDGFSPPFEVLRFNTKEIAESQLAYLEAESCQYDAYTYFWIKEVECD